MMIAFRSVTTICVGVCAIILLGLSHFGLPFATHVGFANAAEQSEQREVRDENKTENPRPSRAVKSPRSESPRANDSQTTEKPSTAQKATESKIAHGKYLVHHVAQCIECHTPRDAMGEMIEDRLLTGASIPVVGPRYAQPWAAESAWIAGLGSYDDAFVHYLLTHGKKPDGSRPKRPMPTFKMTDADATAVIAYLRSL